MIIFTFLYIFFYDMKFIYPLLGCSWRQRPIKKWEANSFYVTKRQNAGRKSQKALRVSFPLQWGRFLGGGDGSFQVVCPTDLEVDLEKLELVTILAARVKVFPYKKGLCNCRSPLNRNIFTWIVRRALNAISDRNKTELFLNRNYCYVTVFKTAKVDPVTFYKRRTTIIIGISG